MNRHAERSAREKHSPLELWGGPECTVVRLGDEWRDQLEQTGHHHRASDIGLIAALGVKRLRFPILWERVAAAGPGRLDFQWTDERLAALESHGIEPIAGLLHHGSGPAFTDLLDPDFPQKFADYALRVASRYPRIRCWTPINEPLTTARFSALYGHWYPHHRDYSAFLRALMNQCLAIASAMQAIRSVNPDARLVQTEDLGKVFSTPELARQAAHENERRWLSLDLLTGRVDSSHAFYSFLRDAGIEETALERLSGGQASPDVIGINHYLTSDRFLDHRLERYPDAMAGGNGRVSYVDAEAIRVAGLERHCGLGPRLHEAWDRYAIPLAVTEVHHGCTRDEQLRWFMEIWNSAHKVRAEGVDLRAVTLWSLFGAFDWRSLMTRRDGHYDPGAFDIRAPAPRPTALAHAAAAYAAGENYDHPVLQSPGWWRRPDRFYPWCGTNEALPAAGRPILITGATGTLGQALARIAARRGLAFRLTARDELDITDPDSIDAALDRIDPWTVVNAAGFVRVMDAEHEVEACMSANAAGAGNLAIACRNRGIPLATFSSDLVFDGLAGRPYDESDHPNPAGIYGQSKFAAEQLVAAAGGSALIIRTSAFFGPWDRHNFASKVIEALRREQPFSASASERVSPTFLPDLCHAVFDLVIDGETGLWHLANEGSVSWFEFARAIAQGAGLDGNLVFAHDTEPPRNTALRSIRGAVMRPLQAALADYHRDVAIPRQSAVDHSAASEMSKPSADAPALL
jgi:dTDP-4-dehydrorhamnose reductase